ncbi:hypothetical protein HanRHA438_Chr14g0647711 [Helianthus annuus]|nr:hypothetical protein HanIR_Chr14g0691161 [Helianthus annuus]KAJ0853133.1 hypothetical protein HanRHA438_Chr14g0647711 [Helianthus annuus]
MSFVLIDNVTRAGDTSAELRYRNPKVTNEDLRPYIYRNARPHELSCFLAFRAFWQFVLSGSSCFLAFHAFWHFMLSGLSILLHDLIQDEVNRHMH